MFTRTDSTEARTVTATWLSALRERWAALDKELLITRLVEEPGACLLYGLKLGRYPHDKQLKLRDDNTVAGMVGWIVVLAGVLAGLFSAF